MSELTVVPSESQPSIQQRYFATAIVVLAIYDCRFPSGLEFSLLAATGMIGLLCLNDHDCRSFGLSLRPIYGWWYWYRMALRFGAIIGIGLAILGTVWVLLGQPIPRPSQIAPTFRSFCFMVIDAPVSEEIIFRLLLTVAILPSLGEFGTIVVSGIVFAVLHILGGNPGLDNQIAGFMLQWSYLKSKTILVPIAMHSGGNLIAFTIHSVLETFWSH